MKRMYFLVLFLSLMPVALRAQSQYQQAADAALTSLDKSGITSGILYDRVFPAANLREPAESSSPGHFRQAQAELYYASYNRTDRLTPDDLKSLIWQSEQQGLVPIGLLVADYHVLNTDAIELDNNNQYRVKNGYNTGQLYQPQQAVVASALSFSVSYGSVGFQLPWWATFSNNRAITNVTIDFGNGQVSTLTPGGGPVYVNYSGPGENTLRYTINLSDGSQRTTTSTLTVGNSGGYANSNNAALVPLNSNPAANYDEPRPRDGFGNIEKLVVESDEAFQGYDESSPSKGKGNAYFYYAQGRNGNELRKPFIVLDGFDAGDERGPNELYGERLKYGNVLLGNELRTNDPARQNQPDYNSDLVLLNFPNYEANCVTKTVCVGYTLTGLCNRPEQVRTCTIRDGGVDYIERNALVLVKLITIINQRLQQSGSTEKITIVGPSMGGLISRYALRYMELHGMNHNCKLWVSFDSPHNGANVSIGTQQFLEHFANTQGQEAAKAALASQIDSPASKQLLIHHYQNGENIGGAPGFRDRFVGVMNSIGFPQAACLRKVAMVNGSKNGMSQSFGDCQEAMRFKFRLTNFATAGCSILAFVGGLVFAPLGALVGGACVTARDRLVDAAVYATPSGSNRCLTFQTAYTGYGAYPVTRYAIGRGTNQPSNDTQPGGTYDAIGILADQINEKGKGILTRSETNTYFRKMSFIPTVSSYALYNTNRNWGASLSGVNVEAETPFKAIYAPDVNQPHVQLTPDNVAFVRAQLLEANSNLQACTGPGGGCNLATNTCYTIKVEATGKRLQAMGYNSILQQLSNGANDQVWKVDDRGNGRVSFTAQDGTNRAIRTANGGNFGEELVLSGYSGNGQQDWAVQCSPSDGNLWRVSYPANNNTWDLRNYGNDPQLQFWGTTSEAFFMYRAFRFEAATCPTGGASCNFAPATITANVPNPTCGQAVTLQGGCNGADCGSVSYAWSGNGISGSGSSVAINVSNANGSYAYTLTLSKPGCANQTASINLTVTGCGGGTTPVNTCIEAESGTGNRNPQSDANASGGQYVGGFGNGSEFMSYSFNLPTTGSYQLKLRYATAVSAGAGPDLVVNGGSPQRFDLPTTGGWLAWADSPTRTLSLNTGNNTIRIQGGRENFALDKVCLSSSGGGRLAAAGVREADGPLVTVSPNPTNEEVRVRFWAKAGEPVRVGLHTLGGRVLHTEVITAREGQNEAVLRLGGLAAGVYLVETQLGGQRVSSKVVKE